MHAFFTSVFYAPLYNGLIFFIAMLPYNSVGLAVIGFTVIVKIILFPLSQKSVRTQFEMKRIEPELNEIKLKYKDNKSLQAEKIMEVYKNKNINPFAGIFLMLIQFPVLVALYYIFAKGGLPVIDHTVLYPFTITPGIINMNFLGANVADKNIYFAVITGIAQYFQIQFTMPKQPKKESKDSNFKDDLSRSMSMQMKFVMPVVIFLIANNLPAVVAIYLITASLFAIGQELYMRRKYGFTKGIQSGIK